MKTQLLVHSVLALVLSSLLTQAGPPMPTAFTYQGQLTVDGLPANGHYDLKFTLCTNATGGSVVTGPITNSAVIVSNGLFMTLVDFNERHFYDRALWLEIAVRTNGSSGDFTALSPLQPLTPTPLGLYAKNAEVAVTASLAYSVATNSVVTASLFDGSVTTNKIAAGQVVKSLSGLHDDVTLAAGANLTLTPGLQTLTLSTPTDWHLGGNPGTTPGAQFLGTTDNQSLELKVNGQRALQLQPTDNTPNLIGGYSGNGIGGGVYGVTIAGGGGLDWFGATPPHTVTDHFGTIGGGVGNTIHAAVATIAGGERNSIASGSFNAVIGGGAMNTVLGGAWDALIAAGRQNTNGAMHGVIAGGYQNYIASGADQATLGGGLNNAIQAGATNTFLGGGALNSIQMNADSAVLGGGLHNTIQMGAFGSVLGGGANNTIEAGAVYGFLGVGWHNIIQANATSCFLGGGAENSIQTDASGSFLGGGELNVIQAGAYDSFLGGGAVNAIQTNAFFCVLGGGISNSIQPYATNCVLGGGWGNSIQANADTSFLGGGSHNSIQSDADTSVLGGGQWNSIGTNAYYSFLGGGFHNSIQSGANNSFLGGGDGNSIQNDAHASVLGGGAANTNGGQLSVVPGGAQNFAGGTLSFAAGFRAKARHVGTFVWADSNSFDFDPFEDPAGPQGVPNSFNVRSTGGFYIVTGIDFANGNILNGVTLTSGSGSWGSYSDRNAKTNCQPVDPQTVLAQVDALPIASWNYKTQDPSIRHLGPMAQDFYATFGVGDSDKTITTVDADGVALAAIQGLNQKLEAELKAKDAEIQVLNRRLDRLEQMLASANR